MIIQKILDEIKQLTPQDGFNIVLHDDFAPWGGKSYTSKACGYKRIGRMICSQSELDYFKKSNFQGIISLNESYFAPENFH